MFQLAEPGRGGVLLSARDVTHRYGGVLALNGVSIDVAEGDFIAILGSNGAGKSTFGAILAGMFRPTQGEVSVGGALARNRAAMIARGVALVPEGRRLFGQLTVAENLMLGGYGAGQSRARIRQRIEDIREILPAAIRDDMARPAAMLSGGEQQMLAIARALVTDPRVLIIDEPSMGLAPILVERVYEILRRLNKDGVAVVLIEQIATMAVRHASSILVIDRGRTVYSGDAHGPEAKKAIFEGYVGKSSGPAMGR